MGLNEKVLSLKWNIVHEQLTSLCVFHRKSFKACEFQSFLTEMLPQIFNNPKMTLNIFNEICYFLLGVINREERDKLIKWPVINIRRQTEFRKGVSTIVNQLIEKYPYFSIKRLQESYLMYPNGNIKKILDFILGLSDLALYIAIDDPSMLIFCNRTDLTNEEIKIAISIIKKARMHEEKLIRKNNFPIDEFENARKKIIHDCVAEKQRNSTLKTNLKKAEKSLAEKVLEKEEDSTINYLKKMNNRKLDELKQLHEQLQIYSNTCSNILSNLNASNQPVYLKAEDLGLNCAEKNFTTITTDACNELTRIFDYLKLNQTSLKEKQNYYENLQIVKEELLKEQNVLESFISRYSSYLNSFCIKP